MKITFTFNKKFFILGIGFMILIASVFFYNYSSKVKDVRKSFFSQTNEKIEFVVSNLQDKILKENHQITQSILQMALNTLPLNSLKIEYKRLLFSKESLIKNSNFPSNINWEVNEVSTDAQNGYVVLQTNNMYRFFNTALVNLEEPIGFKFMLYKDSSVINAVSKLKFSYNLQKQTANNNEAKAPIYKKNIYFLDQPLAELSYTINENRLNQNLQALKQQYILEAGFTMLVAGLVFVLTYFVFIKRMLIAPINAFKKSMKDALDNNFMHKIDSTFDQEDVDEATSLLNKILRKYIAVVNELNINKGILERKVFTDDLTGLPNQKVFELDLKNMFIVGVDGFVGSIKLESLGAFTKESGAALANHLIEEFTHVVQNKFYEVNLQEATLYRFFGSEFAMILKNEDESAVLEFAKSLEMELQELQMRYEIKSDLAYFSFIPFDKYGTIDSILHASSDAYNIAKNNEHIYHVVSPTEVLDKFQFLEQNVREIIEKKSFEVTYGFDTQTLDENRKLIMKEAMPILYDKNREKFSIGVFISVAEKINLAVNFDKSIIESVIKFIQNNEVDYNIAINLSMFSLKDEEFVNWLHSIFLYNKNIAQHLVFSMTSYNASTNIEIFKEFIQEIHRFGSKIILKRFSSNDFTIEQLEELKLDYLRINKDYTSAISKDRDKKHFLRTVINFGQSNDIIIIGDSIKDEKDIEICSTIGLDAISNY